jgi:hypothetical protein
LSIHLSLYQPVIDNAKERKTNRLEVLEPNMRTQQVH